MSKALILTDRPQFTKKEEKELAAASVQVTVLSKFSEDLLDKAKCLARGRLAFGFESPSRIIQAAANNIIFNGKPRGYKELIGEIESFTIEEIENTANKYLDPEKMKAVSLVPKSYYADIP